MFSIKILYSLLFRTKHRVGPQLNLMEMSLVLQSVWRSWDLDPMLVQDERPGTFRATQKFNKCRMHVALNLPELMLVMYFSANHGHVGTSLCFFMWQLYISKHLVRVRKRSHFGLKYLFWSPQIQLRLFQLVVVAINTAIKTDLGSSWKYPVVSRSLAWHPFFVSNSTIVPSTHCHDSRPINM